MTGFCDKQETTVFANCNPVRVVEPRHELGNVAGFRIEDEDVAVAAVFHDVEQACLIRAAETGRSELGARLTEIDHAIRADAQIICVNEWLAVDAVEQRRYRSIQSDALNAIDRISDDECAVRIGFNAQRSATRIGEGCDAPVLDSNNFATVNSDVNATVLTERGIFRPVEFAEIDSGRRLQ